jgi:ABC-type antimicrobial peptide transport system permease subunit
VFPNALILRTRGAAAATSAAIARTITALDPQLPPPTIHDWTQTRDAALVQQRLGLTLFGTFAAAMLLLTIVGLYSVTASRVTQRRQEIGLRIALGASPARVRTTILSSAIAIAAAGLVPGIVLGLTATRVVASILPGLQPSPAVVVAGLALTLIALSALATLAPAQRAASTDPMRVLKD